MMWQFLVGVAAAVACSTGLFAKFIFTDRNKNSAASKVKGALNQEQPSDIGSGCERNLEDNDGIFTFSSFDSKTECGFRYATKDLHKKAPGIKYKISGRTSDGSMKRKRTTRKAAVKDASCSSKDDSLFSWGLCMGMVYTMSAGKAKIDKMNTAMDEVAKVVEELKVELLRKKSSCIMDRQPCDEESLTVYNANSKQNQRGIDQTRKGPRDYNKASDPLVSVGGEYASSVLTEEPDADQEMTPMGQLEAELEAELQKLYLHDPAEAESTLSETENSSKDFQGNEGQISGSSQFYGVMPSELDNKLCHVLIEQQENKITELEFELVLVHTKLHDKEGELQALRDSVKRLTEISLSSSPDDEVDTRNEQEVGHEGNDMADYESRK